MFWRFSFKPGRSVDSSLAKDGLPVQVEKGHYIDLRIGRYVLTDDKKEFIITVQADKSVTVELPKKGNYLDKGHKITYADLNVNSNTLDSLGVGLVTLGPDRARNLEIYADRDFYNSPENSRHSIYWVH